MATYTLTDGTRKTQLTINGDTTVVFPTKLDYFGVRSLDGANILVSKIKAPTTLEDGVYSTDEGDGDVVVDDGIFTDTLYLKGSGTVVVYGGTKPGHLPFKKSGKGGGDEGSLRMLGATTTALTDGATTNPITIDGESVTAVKNDVAIYNTREFYFSGTTWSEFGGTMDTVPTSGSANAVTSDGIYRNTAGKKYYVNNVEKGEIFNNYSAFTQNKAEGRMSHAEGLQGWALGDYSHAEGYITRARGTYSHAGGCCTEATEEAMTAIGKYNNPQTGSLFEIGNGTDSSHPSNVVEVNADRLNVNGDIQANGTSIITQHSTMPTITANMVGKVVQYVGTTDSTYTKGWNYVAVSDGAAEPTYSWAALMDSTPTSGSNNPVTSGGIYTALSGKQDTLTFDTTPTSGSVNAVTSGGVYNIIRKGSTSTSVVLGSTSNQSSGSSSVSCGYYTKATNNNMLVCGVYNESNSGLLFTVGNGSAGNARSNILEAGYNRVNVNGSLQINNVSIPTPYTTMPTVTAAMVGQIAQYVGTTTASYTQGHFYIAASDGAAEPTYSWAELSMSGYRETVLWENDSTTNPQSITLSSAYTNFDALILVGGNFGAVVGTVWMQSSSYPVSALSVSGNDTVVGICDDGTSTWYTISSDTTLTSRALGNIRIVKILGVKY